jgi:hypothetical protein
MLSKSHPQTQDKNPQITTPRVHGGWRVTNDTIVQTR